MTPDAPVVRSGPRSTPLQRTPALALANHTSPRALCAIDWTADHCGPRQGPGGSKSLQGKPRKPISKSNFYGREFWGEGIARAYCHEAPHCLLTITRAVHVARRTT